jgi:ATP-GRASP peptide maturase of grasp-with-spasm system
MVCIFSIEDDASTYYVIKWLIYHGVKFIRVNENDVLFLRELEVDDSNLSLNLNILTPSAKEFRKLDTKEIKSYWFRRGITDIILYNKRSNKLGRRFQKFMINEEDDLKRFFNLIQKDSVYINNFNDVNYNKLYALKCAQELNICTPKTIITTSKNILSNFFLKHDKKIISKAIWNDDLVDYDEKFYRTRASEFFNFEYFDKDIPVQFPPTLFQNYIEKKYEIRSMFINNKFYSMAIFSQNNEQTKLDFRNYDYERPNRLLPFKLPSVVESKLKRLFKKLDLNSGSVDLIYALDNQFYFLEINPIGQFDWLSKNCNYNLEQKIAKTLG